MKFAGNENFTLHHGDNREVLKELADDSIDAIVTDPPYELGFMGKSWDASGIAYDVAMWREALRVLKPGGHLLAFSGSRTYHRMAVAIEDAGFEIRDQIMWIYGSGFPKSLDVSKAIDKNNGEPNRLLKFTAWMRTTGLTAKQLNELTGTMMGGHYLTLASQPAIPTVELWQRIRPHIAEVPDWVDELVQRIEAEREVIGFQKRGQSVNTNFMSGGNDITAPSTDAAKQWDGWGTALKPAHEPIVVARKPLIGTVAANVLTYGTGGLNIDGARVEGKLEGDPNRFAKTDGGSFNAFSTNAPLVRNEGRWPANVIHDGSEEVLELFPNSKGGAFPAKRGNAVNTSFASGQETEGGFRAMGDDGSAARFFYCAKTSKRDRNEGLEGFEIKQTLGGGGLTVVGGAYGSIKAPSQNHHPTVKPTDLMRYLCRLVTPKGGIVLDPFTGSGSTGKAAIYEGFNFIGIEMTDEYLPIAKARIEFAINNREETLFDA